MAGRRQTFSTMTTRQKVTAIIFVVIVLILIWQLYKIFGASRGAPRPPRPATTPAAGTSSPATAANVQDRGLVTPTTPPATAAPAPGIPQQGQLIGATKAPVTPEDQAMSKLQQETQTRYLTAVSELQMLKVARDIAETNQAIMTARLSAVTSQKKIVDMLAPPPPPPAAAPPIPTIPLPSAQQRTLIGQGDEIKYVVISVAQIQYRWSAVVGAKGLLYNVRVGDILPLDNSRVIRIDSTGVTIQRNGVRKRLSLVPII